MFKVSEAIEYKVLLLDDDGDPTAGTVAYVIYDEGDVSFATGNMSTVAGVTGLYTMTFTPDAAGEWTVKLSCSSPTRNATKIFYVGKGVEQDIRNNMALETTFTAIKGAGWTNETLKAIYDLVNGLNDLAQTDILADATPFNGADIVAIKNYVDEVESLLKNGTYGLSALNTDLDTLLARVTAARAGYLDELDFDLDARLGAPAGASMSVDIAAIKTELDHGTYGLSALEALIDEVETLLKNGTYGLAALETLVDEIESLLKNGTYGLSAIETLIDEVETLLKNGTYGLSALDTELGTVGTNVGTLLTRLSATRAGYLDELDFDLDARLGSPAGASISADLASIKTVVDAISGYVDTEVGAIKTETDKIPHIISYMDFKSLPLQITITSTAGDRGLVDIVVSGLPTGITIIAVEGIFYCDSVENSFDGTNYLESTKIQVKEKTAGTDRDAITLEANKIFRFTDDMVRGGTVLTADWATAVAVGILAEVTGNATYQMWFDVGETAQNNIVLDGAVFMLRIWFY